MYAFYTDKIGNVEGTFKTTDGGDSWAEVNSISNGTSYHWWFGGVFVDPTDENIVYNSGFVMEKTLDGGTTWGSTFSNVHVDQHAVAFNTQVPGEVLIGNDGGLYKSSTNGDTYQKDNTLPITQFYRFYVDPQNENKVYGGTQDNNTIRTTSAGIDDWQPIFGGDGFQPLVQSDNTNIIYALSQRGNLGKSTNDGVSFNGALNGIPSSDVNNWDTAITFDPADSQTLYYGTQRIYKTTNGAGNWGVISPDLSNGPHSGNLAYGTVTSIDVSPLDSNLIYAGTDDGNVWVTQDSGTNWTLVSDTLPNLWVTKVLASSSNVSQVYVTYSGYRYGEEHGHVFKSDDYGTTWNDISNNLPDIPVNDILKDNYGNLFLGTDIGVLASADEGENWEPLGVNMPSVVVNDLHIHENSEYLYVATYGRSSYKLDISNNILSTSSTTLASAITLYPNPASDYVNLSFIEAGEDYKIEIYDALGKKVLQKNNISSSSDGRIYLNGISPGIYYINIYSDTDQTTKKLVVN